jgi:rare lipoprotein A
VLALGAFALAACTSSGPFGSKSQYSKRMIEDGEPIPKGGGNYKVGQPYQLRGKTYYPGEEPNYRAEGVASWYGPDFHGRATANGEVYDMHGISAAHPTLPLPSYLRVTNLANGRSVIVRLNDRGPYVSNRLIDLSIGAAKALDFYNKGLARVRVEYVGRAPLEGTDDQKLLATLRDGSPAPAPSQVMIASAKPFVAQLGESPETARASVGTPVPAARPFTVGAPSGRTPGRLAAETTPPERKPRSVVRVSNAPPEQFQGQPAGQAAMTGAGFAPASAQGLGLMSGRGLY